MQLAKETWEYLYSSGQHWNSWPFSEVVSLVHRFTAIQKGSRVLELGCGVGNNIPFFLSLEIEYFGIEASNTAVTAIQKKHPTLSQNVLCGDFTESLPFSPSFDLIFDRSAMTHNPLPKVGATVKRIYELLKPGGVYVGTHWFSENDTSHNLGDPLPGDPKTRIHIEEGPYRNVSPLRFFSRDELLKLFTPFEWKYLREEKIADWLNPMVSQQAFFSLVVKKPTAGQ